MPSEKSNHLKLLIPSLQIDDYSLKSSWTPLPEELEKAPLLCNSCAKNPCPYNSVAKKKIVSVEESSQTGIGWPSIAFGLANAAIGVGVLNYPQAYDRVGGIENATFIQIALISVLFVSMAILVYCADLHGSNSYHEVLSAVCGKRAQLICAADIFLSTYGVCVTYFIIIGDQYDRIFASIIGDEFCGTWYYNRKFTIVATSLLIFPICYSKRLDFLKHTGPLGIFAMLYVVFLTIYQHYTLDVEPGPLKTKADSILNIMAVIPVMCFGYQCNEVIIPIYASLKERKLSHFFKAALVAWGVLIFLYCTVGTYGYKTFGSNVGADVMQHFNARDPIVLIGIIALVLKMALTYPQMSFVGRGAFDCLYSDCSQRSEEDLSITETRRRVIVTTVWFLSTLFFALFAPNIGIVIELLGTLAAANVFIFPSVCLLCLVRRKDLAYSTQVKAAFVMIASILIPLGISFVSLVLYQVYLDILNLSEEKSLCSL